MEENVQVGSRADAGAAGVVHRRSSDAALVRAAEVVHRRASDAALRRAADVVRKSFVQIAQRQAVADGFVVKALADALAAVESALPRADDEPED
jgi:hypothetical protein